MVLPSHGCKRCKSWLCVGPVMTGKGLKVLTHPLAWHSAPYVAQYGHGSAWPAWGAGKVPVDRPPQQQASSVTPSNARTRYPRRFVLPRNPPHLFVKSKCVAPKNRQ